MRYNKLLITGGLGYIGSNIVYQLHRSHPTADVVILDNQENCQFNDIYLNRLSSNKIKIIRGNIENINDLLPNEEFDAVIHLGANAYVGESVTNPNKYFGLNLTSTYELARFCRNTKVEQLIFSSTCAVYGTQSAILTERSELSPQSPYAYSKLFSEQILERELRGTTKLTVFRYFNVAGANPEFEGGEFHTTETHLIPVIFRKLENGEPITIFGGDYDTPDGTCVREYVHVSDIAEAHLKALKSGREGTFNLGSSQPNSNLQVLKHIERICNRSIQYSISERRTGDATCLHSSNKKAQRELGWLPKKSSLDKIINDYWEWLQIKR